MRKEIFEEDNFYHIYNRGVDKRLIFKTDRDRIRFINSFRLLNNFSFIPSHFDFITFEPVNFLKPIEPYVEVAAGCLMDNHFHFLLKQYTKDGVTKLMRRVMTSYVMYFNRKYKRVGALFQNSYKGALIDKDEYLLQCSRYIHLNPTKIHSAINFLEFSSYPNYLGTKHASWVKPREILEYFGRESKGVNSYKKFVENLEENSEDVLGDLILDED